MKKISSDALRNFLIRQIVSSGAAIPDDLFWKIYSISGLILIHYLGIEWYDKYVMPPKSPKNYLRTGPTTPEDSDIHTQKIIALAELLYNFQGIEGFTSYINEFKKREDIESKNAELTVAKLLKIKGIKFKFVIPKGVKGEDYDIELLLAENVWAPCEVKCKIEGSQLSNSTIINSFNDMRKRKQLPKDRAGVVFVSVPQHWMDGTEQWSQAQETYEDTGLVKIAREATLDLFNNTSRVLLVVFFCEAVVYFPDSQDDTTKWVPKQWFNTIFAIDEFVNKKSPFISYYKKALIVGEEFQDDMPEIETPDSTSIWESLSDIVSPDLMKKTYDQLKKAGKI